MSTSPTSSTWPPCGARTRGSAAVRRPPSSESSSTMFPNKVARGVVVPFGAYYAHYRNAAPVAFPKALAGKGLAREKRRRPCRSSSRRPTRSSSAPWCASESATNGRSPNGSSRASRSCATRCSSTPSRRQLREGIRGRARAAEAPRRQRPQADRRALRAQRHQRRGPRELQRRGPEPHALQPPVAAGRLRRGSRRCGPRRSPTAPSRGARR